MKIALDVMGGDHAPAETVAGAVRAVEKGFADAANLVLVGDRARIEAELAARQPAPAFEIVHASENIGMDEHPAQALRKKRDSSIVVGARLVKDKKVDAFVSAGNTGAMVGAATFFVRLLEGVRRPAIAVTFGSARGPCTLIDVGANVHCQPEDLYVYAAMASDYMRGIHGIASPRVGLLNIGEEEGKGNPLILETRALLKQSALNFVGNIEGNQVFEGNCDVVVAEGFVGNVVLKVAEGLGQFVSSLFADQIRKHGGEAGEALLKAVAHSVMARTDYAEYGGAPLLGVDGLFIICHGRSDARAIANALKVSARFIESDVNRHIVEGLRKSPVHGHGGDPSAQGAGA